MAERQQDHFGSPMAAGARGAARGEREGKVEVRDGFFFWLGAAWVKSRAERPSVSGVN